MEPLLLTLALLAYLLVAVLRLPGVVEASTRTTRVGDVAMWAAPLLHMVGLTLLALRLQTLPILSAGQSLLSLACILGVANVLLRKQPRAEVLAGVLSALCVTLVGLGLILPNQVSKAPEGLSSLWFPLHAAMILLGLGGFALAFGVSALYLVVRDRLKRKRLADLGRLPSIDALDRLNTRFILLGFLALTFGIATGGLWAVSRPQATAPLGATVYASLVLWGWYAAAVLVRVVGGWRGPLAAHFSVVGFLGLVVGLGAIVLSASGWHG